MLIMTLARELKHQGLGVEWKGKHETDVAWAGAGAGAGGELGPK